MNKIIPSHVAILVPSVNKALGFLSKFNLPFGKINEFESEGTREVYFGDNISNSLLLMEAIKEGPYKHAFDKRGPGLHHLAIDVENLDVFITKISSSGWLLHPMSLTTIKNSKTAYLARPGFPALIEVHEKSELNIIEPENLNYKGNENKEALFVKEINLKMNFDLSYLLKPIGLDKIVKPSVNKGSINIDDNIFNFEELF